IQAASWLLERLNVLRDAGDMPGLLAAFRAFSEALLLLSNLTAQRLQELRDCPRRESLAQALQLLQKCAPLLHAAKHSDLKRSRDPPVDLSKAFQLTERTITELTSLLIDDTGGKEPGDGNGTFSQHTSRLQALLSRPDPAHLCDSEFSAHVEAVVSYCMLLAASSRREQKLELVKRCWALLQLRRRVCSHVSQQEGRLGQSWGESLEKECHAMREEVENLDQAVLAATLCQILDTFFEGKEPLRRLVAEALSIAGTGCFPAGQGGFLKRLQPLIGTFFTHAQAMLRVADFVLARCTKTQTAGEIRDQVEYLKSLLARLPPLLTEMSRDTAAGQLQSLYRAWAGTTESLLRRFEEMLGTRELLTLSVQEMARHRDGCEEALAGQDPEGLSGHAARLTRWAQWVLGATARSVDRATDPIFRNGLLVWVEQLASAILELKALTALYPESPSCPQTRAVFSKAASCLVAAARRVRDGLDGSNHPDILSPLRERVRSADVAKALELSPPHAGLETVTLHKDTVSCPSPPAGNPHPGAVPRKGEMHPVVAALLAAARAHDVAAVGAAGSALLQLSSGCVDAAKAALPVAESPQLETLGQHQEIVSLTPHVLSLARETAARQLPHPSGLLQTALALSKRICETTECLAAVAGPWYSLSQQALGFFLAADFLRGKQAVDEAMMGLAGAVELAGDIARKGSPISPDVQESFLQVQAKFLCAQMNTKVLLETAASLEGCPRAGEASLELRCIQWAVGTHVLLGAVDGFIGRDVLFPRELRNAVKKQLCLQSLLAAVSENSLRLQEAARLSSLSCPEERGRGEILTLREEIKVLMEALLDAANTLSLSPLSAASLFVRFELLQTELALRAKALVLHLEMVNPEHLRVIRDVLGAALSPLAPEDGERRREAFEEKAKQLLANVQWVKTTLADVLQGTAQGNLLPTAEHLLVLTSEAVGSARQLLQSRGDEGLLHLESIVLHWAAAAHCLQTQLRAVRGVHGHVLQLITQCLCNAGAQHHGTAEPLPALELETCPSESRRASGAAGEARETVQ
ncbi:CTNA1 protein, partial [Pterocles burchelli]|nr:CTNA1 protein [Pterocles burchelli]